MTISVEYTTRLLLLLTLGALTLPLSARAQNNDAQEVEKLLKTLSLKQKIGQMLLPTYQYILKPGTSEVDVTRLKAMWGDFGLGTIYGPRPVFSYGNRIGGFCKDWSNLIKTAQTAALESGSPPILFGLLAQHGANYLANATIFPHNIGAGATFNPELIEIAGQITGKDLRSCGIAWAISPAIDIAIEPRWARHYECYSSDPYLSAVLSYHAVRGYENRQSQFFSNGRAQVGTIVKHFVGYSNPDSGGDREDATNPDWMIERFHLPPFRSAFAAGALAVMYNSGTVNKIPGHANPSFTVSLLRQKLNFTGVSVSDYDDVSKLVNTHRRARNFREAVKLALDAGLDVTMIPDAWAATTLSLVESGEVGVARIDESIRRILMMKRKLGLFETSGPFEQFTNSVGQQKDRNVALQMAEESITLLKNRNNTLPIPTSSATKGTILVTGPCGSSIRLQSGGWTITWEGANNDDEFYGHGASFFQGIKSIAEENGWQTIYIEGSGLESWTNAPEALSAARNANYTIVCLGEKPYVEFTYNIQDLFVISQTMPFFSLHPHLFLGLFSRSLQKPQLDYVAELRKVSQNLVLVLAQGRPRMFTSLIPLADAIVYTYLPGPYGGPALANILFGKTNPSGKLSFSYPSASNQLTLQYGRWKHTPQWDFGFGLSYSKFEFSDLDCPEVFNITSTSADLTVTVKVTNVGPMAGKEVAILWLSDFFAYPNPELVLMPRRFQKVELQVGESAMIAFALKLADFRHLLAPAAVDTVNVTIRVGPLTKAVLLSASPSLNVPIGISDPLPSETVTVKKFAPPTALPVSEPTPSTTPTDAGTPTSLPYGTPILGSPAPAKSTPTPPVPSQSSTLSAALVVVAFTFMVLFLL